MPALEAVLPTRWSPALHLGCAPHTLVSVPVLKLFDPLHVSHVCMVVVVVVVVVIMMTAGGDGDGDDDTLTT